MFIFNNIILGLNPKNDNLDIFNIIFSFLYNRHPGKGAEYPDLFNYLQYTCFAFPVAFAMFIFNFLYHMLLINW